MFSVCLFVISMLSVVIVIIIRILICVAIFYMINDKHILIIIDNLNLLKRGGCGSVQHSVVATHATTGTMLC